MMQIQKETEDRHMQRRKIIALMTALVIAMGIAGCNVNNRTDGTGSSEVSEQSKDHSDGSHSKKPSQDSARPPEEGKDKEDQSEKVKGTVKSVSGKSVTLVTEGSDKEVTLDLSSVKDLDMEKIVEGKTIVITLDDSGNPSKVKVKSKPDGSKPDDRSSKPSSSAQDA